MNKLQSYFIASVLYVMTPHAFAQGTVTIYLPGEQQTLSVGPVENVVQLVTQPQLRDRLWWPGALLTDSAAKAKALKDYQHVMAQLASWEAEADDDVAATIKSVRQQLLNLNITGRLPVMHQKCDFSAFFNAVAKIGHHTHYIKKLAFRQGFF